MLPSQASPMQRPGELQEQTGSEEGDGPGDRMRVVSQMGRGQQSRNGRRCKGE